MADNARIDELVERIFALDQSPEEVCADCPELLPAVRERWRQCKRVQDDLEAMFPSSTAGEDRSAGSMAGELPVIPGYEVDGVLGRGGMGVVYKARQLKLGRTVAIKMLLAGPYAATSELARFSREAEAIAALRHENIVQVFGVGDLSGRPFFSMEFIEGGSLAEHLAGAPQTPQQAATLMVRLARAVQSAHERGIIHRDLKPANVLLTADGTPKITDFGVAHWSESESFLTVTGGHVGTPSYMAPEQATSSVGSVVGGSADIYSLGAILYEMLTGRPPFHGATSVETLWQAAHHDPVAPKRLVPGIPRDLDTICLKCLEKNPANRYTSAGELADDLERLLANVPVKARPVGWVEYLHRWVLRHRPMAAALAGLVLLLLATVVASLLAAGYFHRLESTQHSVAVEMRRVADEKGRLVREKEIQTEKAIEAEQGQSLLRDEAEKQGESFRHHLYFAQMNLSGQASHFPSGLGRVHEGLAPWENSQPDLRNWEWYYLNGLCHRDLKTLLGHGDAVTQIAWSPDGTLLASGGSDNTARIWDPIRGEEILIPCHDHGEAILALAWNPAGTLLATGGWGGTVKIWARNSPGPRLVFKGHTGAVFSVSWSPDGKVIASSGLEQIVRIWDPNTGQTLKELHGHENSVCCVAWNPAGTRLATGSRDATIRIWDAASAKEQLVLRGHANWVNEVRWSADGGRLVSCSNDQTAKIWNAADGKELLTLRGHSLGVRTAAWDGTGSRVATGSDDQTIRIWNADDGQEQFLLRGQSAPITSVAWSRDSTRIASSSDDSTIKIWNVNAGPETRTLKGHEAQVDALAWSSDGHRIVSSSADETARVWDVASGRELLKIRHDLGRICGVVWSPDRTKLATAGVDHTVRVWDAQTGAVLRVLPGSDAEVFTVAWSPDGKKLASGGSDKVIRVWDALSGQPLFASRGHGQSIYSVAWSPDGLRYASGSVDFDAKIWDGATGEEIRTLHGHRLDVNQVAWSPDGHWLATASADQTIGIWNTDTGQAPRILRGHTARVNGVAWTPDGTRLASAGDDHTVKIWDVVDGGQTVTLEDSIGLVRAVAWSPDGLCLACSGLDQTIRLYDATAGYIAARSLRYLPTVDRRLKSDPNSPADWKLRTEIHARNCDWKAAEVDAKRCLALMPQTHLLVAGCWSVGPYPEDMSNPQPPESSLDPSRSVPPADGSSARLAWEPVELNARGFVNFGTRYAKAEHVSGYALFKIYSVDDRTAALLVGSDDQARVWLDGTRVYECLNSRVARADEDAVSVKLHAGWNTVLTRVANVTGNHLLYLRFSEAPADLLRGGLVDRNHPAPAP